jgi:hypothetical protein
MYRLHCRARAVPGAVVVRRHRVRGRLIDLITVEVASSDDNGKRGVCPINPERKSSRARATLECSAPSMIIRNNKITYGVSLW